MRNTSLKSSSLIGNEGSIPNHNLSSVIVNEVSFKDIPLKEFNENDIIQSALIDNFKHEMKNKLCKIYEDLTPRDMAYDKSKALPIAEPFRAKSVRLINSVKESKLSSSSDKARNLRKKNRSTNNLDSDFFVKKKTIKRGIGNVNSSIKVKNSNASINPYFERNVIKCKMPISSINDDILLSNLKEMSDIKSCGQKEEVDKNSLNIMPIQESKNPNLANIINRVQSMNCSNKSEENSISINNVSNNN